MHSLTSHSPDVTEELGEPLLCRRTTICAKSYSTDETGGLAGEEDVLSRRRQRKYTVPQSNQRPRDEHPKQTKCYLCALNWAHVLGTLMHALLESRNDIGVLPQIQMEPLVAPKPFGVV
jgi:hypothetical protein